ncbi:MAG: cupin domain-containing protein [Pseudomonadota bacterium]
MQYQRFRSRVQAMVICGGACLFALGILLGVYFGQGLSVDMATVSTANAAEGPALVTLDPQRLGGGNLGEFEPYLPEVSDLIARGHEYFYSADQQFGVGVWESKPGTLQYSDTDYDELMYVLDGALIMTARGGTPQRFGPGEGFVLPSGWSGELEVPEGGVRKIWVSYMSGLK